VKPQRLAVQVAIGPDGDVAAVASDGTLWWLDAGGDGWQRLPDLPGPKTRLPSMAEVMAEEEAP
jgi:hypothetical protein